MTELETPILRRRDELADVRAGTQRTPRRLLITTVLTLAASLVLAGGGWGAWRSPSTQGVESAVVDESRIRVSLTDASKRRLDTDLAAAEALATWDEREAARAAADAAHESRRRRIDELVRFLASVEERDPADGTLRELERVLADDGVESALAFMESRRGGILNRVLQQAESDRSHNRAALEPLVVAAQLAAIRGEPAAARAMFMDIVALEPEWPRAVVAFGYFLIDTAQYERQHGSLVTALADATLAVELTSRLGPVNGLDQDQARTAARAMFSLSRVLQRLGRPGDADAALDSLQRGLDISERHLRDNPGSAEAARDVAIGLDMLADLLQTLGRPGDAVAALDHLQRSLDILQRLLRDNPGSAEAASDVSISLNNLAVLLRRVGRPGDVDTALAHLQRSLDIRERLLRDDSGSAEAARDVAISLAELADLLQHLGRPGDADAALDHLQRALDIGERLLRDNPGSAQAARDVSISLNRLAELLDRLGRPGDADATLAHLQCSLNIRERVLRDNPGSAQAARDVSVSLDKLAVLIQRLGRSGDADAALVHLQRSLDIRERLLRDNPGSAQAVRDVAFSLVNLADLLEHFWRPGDADAALAHRQRSLDISERLLRDNPGSAQAARDVSMSLERLATILQRLGRPGDADTVLAHLQRSLDINERLLRDNPGSALAARGVSMSLEHLADFLQTLGRPGDADAALAHLQRGLDISERLLRDNPGSSQAARDVFVGHVLLAEAHDTVGDAGLATRHWRACRGILDWFEAEGRFMDSDMVELHDRLKADGVTGCVGGAPLLR